MYVIKKVNIKHLVRTTRFWNNLHRVGSKPTYLKSKHYRSRGASKPNTDGVRVTYYGESTVRRKREYNELMALGWPITDDSTVRRKPECNGLMVLGWPITDDSTIRRKPEYNGPMVLGWPIMVNRLSEGNLNVMDWWR
jgi:hypothetical protein